MSCRKYGPGLLRGAAFRLAASTGFLAHRSLLAGTASGSTTASGRTATLALGGRSRSGGSRLAVGLARGGATARSAVIIRVYIGPTCGPAMLAATGCVMLVYIIPLTSVWAAGLPAGRFSTGAWADAATLLAGSWLAVAVVFTNALDSLGSFNALTLTSSER